MMDGHDNNSEMRQKIYADHVKPCFNHFRPVVDNGELAAAEMDGYNGTKGRKHCEPMSNEEVLTSEAESEYQ